MEVRQEDVLEVDEPDVGAEELALRALAAVDEQPVAAAPDERCRRGPLGGGSRARRPEEHDVEVHERAVYGSRRLRERGRAADSTRSV